MDAALGSLGAVTAPIAMTSLTRDLLDEPALRELLGELGREAALRRFDVAPNPCVGVAIVRGASVVARGVHGYFGGPHAEIVALENARRIDSDPASWDTLVTTLEPCSSVGKTGACTSAILDGSTGIRRVVVGALDPDPRHRGQGIEILREAGLEVIVLEGASPLEQVAPHFLRWMAPDRLRRPRPWTIAKWAQTRTGQLTPPADVGAGRWISSAESQAEVQLLRGRVDAIITGVGTVLADDPRLTVRLPGDTSRAPLRVILDSYLRTPPESRLFQPPGEDEGAGEVHIVCLAGPDGARQRALEEVGAQVHGVHSNRDDHVRLWEVQSWLWGAGVRRVLLETGPILLSRSFELSFVDQVRIYTGSVNGGRGPSMGPWISSMRFEGREDREVSSDAVIDGFLEPTER